MAQTMRLMPVEPERVFAVLADPGAYGSWVVGSDTIRDADAQWPAPGSRFHHRVGIGPLKIRDHTEVLAADPPRRLELLAKARPLGRFRVELTLEPVRGGTRVTMVEEPGDLRARLLINPLTLPLTRRRNALSLRRLERLALAR